MSKQQLIQLVLHRMGYSRSGVGFHRKENRIWDYRAIAQWPERFLVEVADTLWKRAWNFKDVRPPDLCGTICLRKDQEDINPRVIEEDYSRIEDRPWALLKAALTAFDWDIAHRE